MFMKNTILKFIISRAGVIITPFLAVLVAAVAVKIDPFSHELAEQLKGPEVIGWLTALVIAMLSGWAHSKQREGAKEIQRVLVEAGQENVKVDGVIGPITVANAHVATGVPEPPPKKKKFRLRWPWARE